MQDQRLALLEQIGYKRFDLIEPETLAVWLASTIREVSSVTPAPIAAEADSQAEPTPPRRDSCDWPSGKCARGPRLDPLALGNDEEGCSCPSCEA